MTAEPPRDEFAEVLNGLRLQIDYYRRHAIPDLECVTIHVGTLTRLVAAWDAHDTSRALIGEVVANNLIPTATPLYLRALAFLPETPNVR